MSSKIQSKEFGSIPIGKATAVKISTFTNKDGSGFPRHTKVCAE